MKSKVLFVLGLVSLQWAGAAFAEDYSVLREGRLLGQRNAEKQQALEQRKRQQELMEQRNMLGQLLSKQAASQPDPNQKPYVNPRDNVQKNPDWHNDQINNAFSFDANKNQWDYSKQAPTTEQQNYQAGRTYQQEQNQPPAANNEPSNNIFGSGSSGESGANPTTQQNFYY